MTPYERADEYLSQAIRFRSAWRSARRRAKRLRGVAFLALFKQDVAVEAGRRYKVERDEARAEVVRLGRRLEEVRAEGIEALEREP